MGIAILRPHGACYLCLFVVRFFQSLLVKQVTVVRVRCFGCGHHNTRIMKTANRHPRSNDFRHDDERLRFVIRASGLYTGLFAQRIGLPDGEVLHNVLARRQPLTAELVSRIHACYPQINAIWLLTGRTDECY